jgi:hypothetical protein
MKYLPPRSPPHGDSSCCCYGSRGALSDSKDKNRSAIIIKDHGTYWDQLPAEARDLPPLWQRLEREEQALRRKRMDAPPVEGTSPRRHGIFDVLLGQFGW